MHHPEITFVGAITIVQVAPIKLDPWTALARWFKKIIVGDIEKKLDALSTKVDRLEHDAGESAAKTARAHIQRFADELYTRQVKHSKGYFDDILDDIKFYNNYVAKHKDFENGRTEFAVGQIEKVYKELFETQDFL